MKKKVYTCIPAACLFTWHHLFCDTGWNNISRYYTVQCTSWTSTVSFGIGDWVAREHCRTCSRTVYIDISGETFFHTLINFLHREECKWDTCINRTFPLVFFFCFNILVASFIQPMQNKTVMEGGNAILSCNASGIPPPMVSWIKVGGHMRTNGSELVFTNLNRSEAGEYRCEASNECGNAPETVTLEVQCKWNIFSNYGHYSMYFFFTGIFVLSFKLIC